MSAMLRQVRAATISSVDHRPLPGRAGRRRSRRPGGQWRQGRHRLDAVRSRECTERLARRAARHAGRDPRRRACTRTSASSPHPQSAHVPPADGRRRAELLRQQLPRPRRPPARRRRRQGGAGRVGLRDGQRPVHLRHADPARRARGAAVARSSAPRRRSCSPPASTPTAACSRCCSTTEDAVISDELNHASIIDGIRLCKAKRLRYRNRDMADLEAQLQAPHGRPAPAHRHRRRLLDGRLPRAPGRDLRPGRALRRAGDGRRLARGRLRRRRRARARPSCSACRTASTSSPARSARRSAARPAATSRARAEIVELLRQRSRPYLFSNAVAPSVVAGSLAALDLVAGGDEQRAALRATPRCSAAG